MCVSSVLCSDISVKIIWAGDSVNAIRSGSWALLLQMILSVVQSPCLVKSSFLLLWSSLLWNPPRSANKKTVCKICWGWALPFFFFSHFLHFCLQMNVRLLTVLVPSRCWVFQDCHKSVGKQSWGLVVVMEEKEEKEGEKRDVLFVLWATETALSKENQCCKQRTMKFGLSSDSIKIVHNDIFHITWSFRKIWGISRRYHSLGSAGCLRLACLSSG